jgi:hypothetical protein
MERKRWTAGALLLLGAWPQISLAALEPTGGLQIIPLDQILSRITTWVLDFGILLCVLMIIWGGLNYVAAVGDEQRITAAKKTVHYAIWGILIIGCSYAILKSIDKLLAS